MICVSNLDAVKKGVQAGHGKLRIDFRTPYGNFMVKGYPKFNCLPGLSTQLFRILLSFYPFAYIARDQFLPFLVLYAE
jgi:hypothetical protein